MIFYLKPRQSLCETDKKKGTAWRETLGLGGPGAQWGPGGKSSSSSNKRGVVVVIKDVAGDSDKRRSNVAHEQKADGTAKPLPTTGHNFSRSRGKSASNVLIVIADG